MRTKQYESSIWSMDQAINFYNKIMNAERCGNFTTDFFCIAARKKYLSEEDKKLLHFGDTCMMNKTILKTYDERNFAMKLRQADACLDYFLDRDGWIIPRNCMVFYANINHTDVFKAIKDFKYLMADWDYDLNTMLQFKNDNKEKSIGKQVKTIQNNLLKSFQDPKNKVKYWMDFDCDIENSYSVSDLFGFIRSLIGENVYIITTHGGAHILISYKALHDKNLKIANEITNKKHLINYILTPANICTKIKEYFDGQLIKYKEVTFNQNAAVPIPGTLQNNFEVRMI